MGKTTLTILIMAVFSMASCSSSKKSTVAVAVPPPASGKTTENTSISPFLTARPSNDVSAPGNKELAAIQVKYKDVTLDQLKEGYILYTEGACIDCHRAKSIYKYEEVEWNGIMDDMARRAKISDAQKDVVYKYVLAMKATQQK